MRCSEKALDAELSYPAARLSLRNVFARLSLFDMVIVNRRIGRLAIAVADLDPLLEHPGTSQPIFNAR